MASASAIGSPACARSSTACPISVGTSTIAPAVAPFLARVSSPPATSAPLPTKNLAPNTVKIESNAACGIAVSAAAPSLISVRIPRSIASFWRSRFEPKNNGNAAKPAPIAAPITEPGIAPTPPNPAPIAAPAAPPAKDCAIAGEDSPANSPT